MFNIKRILAILLSAITIVSCSEGTMENTGDVQQTQNLSTQATVNGTMMYQMRTVASMSDMTGQDKAYFYIRIDNRIPGCESYSPKLYFPQSTNGGSLFSDNNGGTIDKGKIDKWSIGENHISYYIYDTTGKETLPCLVKTPSIKDILSANRNNAYNTSSIDTDNLKVIWYIVKKEDGIWHADGVLTDRSTSDITEIEGIDEDTTLYNRKDNARDTIYNTEIDIHQQEHRDWGEIKTTVHLRNTEKDTHLTITMPIKREYTIEKDDFAIRKWNYYSTYDTADTTPYVTVTATHTDTEIIYEITCSKEYIAKCINGEGKDGVTIEIHSYTTTDSHDKVWGMIRKTTVTPSVGDGLRITTAFNNLK